MKYPLFIEGYGVYVNLASNTLVINQNSGESETVSLSRISHLLIKGPAISLSSAVFLACGVRGIPVSLLDNRGRPQVVLYHPKLKRSLTERTLTESDKKRLVARLLQAKVRRQTMVIHYHIRSLRLNVELLPKPLQAFHHQAALAALNQVTRDTTLGDESWRQAFFLAEARASRRYWRDYAQLVPEPWGFPGRRKHHAPDTVNQLLNYGYALLSGHVMSGLLKAGVDPSWELLHHRQGVTFPIQYDIMEPFRPLIDHMVLRFIHRQHKSLQDKNGVLRPAVLRRFRRAWQTVAARPQPWSKNQLPLEALILEMIVHLAPKSHVNG